MLKVRDIMTAEPATVSPGTSLRDVMELFTREHISGAPVVNAGRLVGVISSSDLLAFAAAPPESTFSPDVEESFDRLAEIEPDHDSDMAADTVSDSTFFTCMLNDSDTDVEWFAGALDPNLDVLDEYTVADAMTTTMQTIGPEEDATAAARLLSSACVHRLIVVDRGHLAGIISTTDLTRAVAERRLPGSVPAPAANSRDFDAGWSHEPIMPYDDDFTP